MASLNRRRLLLLRSNLLRLLLLRRRQKRRTKYKKRFWIRRIYAERQQKGNLKSVWLATFFAAKKYEWVGIIPTPFFSVANGWRFYHDITFMNTHARERKNPLRATKFASGKPALVSETIISNNYMQYDMRLYNFKIFQVHGTGPT
jgi:hypothetical protein